MTQLIELEMYKEPKLIQKVIPIKCALSESMSEKLEEDLRSLPGVVYALMNLSSSTLRLSYDANRIEFQNIMDVVDEQLGNKADDKEYKSENLLIKGLDCADCAAKLEQKVAAVPDVKNARINFGASKLLVEYEGSLDRIITVIRQSGYDIHEEEKDEAVQKGFFGKIIREPKTMSTYISGILLAVGILLDFFTTWETGAIVFFFGAMISGGFYVARSGLLSLRSFSLDMNFLMTIAIMGAIAIGEYSEGATVVFLYSLGNTLQAYTMDKTRTSIRDLMKLSPKEATVLEDGNPIKKKVEEVVPGDIVLVRPGERIPVDGTIVNGSSTVNQAPITGESIPIEKKINDSVYAGTMNKNGALEINVTKPVSDTTLAKIINLVEEAQAQKAPSQQFIDVFAKYYTPIVVVTAVLIAIVPYFMGLPFILWFKKALILLVIACPCALVISTPVTIVSGIGSAAKNGVLIKGGAYLEKAGNIKVVAFDKTGTLTQGKPEVIDIIDYEGKGWQQVVSIAAAIERYSEHPLGEAVKAYAEQNELSDKKAEAFEAITGKGAKAIVDGKEYFIGSYRLFNELGAELEPILENFKRLEKEGKTVLMVGTKDGIDGLITVADAIRQESKEAVENLKKAGIEKVVMLTGDNKGTAKAVASNLKVDEFKAELLPEDKLTFIKSYMQEYEHVGMVGDGINDAPAMATASIGIGMGGAGNDSALETADIVLMADDISKLPYTMKLSRKALRILKENIIIALLIKAVFIVLTFMGMANLWMAVFADTGAALIVIANGMRLLKRNVV